MWMMVKKWRKQGEERKRFVQRNVFIFNMHVYIGSEKSADGYKFLLKKENE